jgi:hypothetical protein
MLPKPTKATFSVGSPDGASMPLSLSVPDDDDDVARAQTCRELSHATATTVRFANDGRTVPRPRRESVALHLRLRSDNESMFRSDQWEILLIGGMCVIVMVGGEDRDRDIEFGGCLEFSSPIEVHSDTLVCVVSTESQGISLSIAITSGDRQ